MHGKTIAFDNIGKVWKTRYSFIPTCYSYVDKKFLSCRQTSNTDLIWRHDVRRQPFNNFYGRQYKSSLKASFNDNVSVNKIYKSLSLEGTENLAGGQSRFLANSTSEPAQMRDAVVGRLQEKGGILYAPLGRGTKTTNSNLNAIGVARSITPLWTTRVSSASELTALLVSDNPPETIYGYSYNLKRFFLEIDFFTHNFMSSSSFKIIFGGAHGFLGETTENISNGSYTSTTAYYLNSTLESPSGVSKATINGKNGIIVNLEYQQTSEIMLDILSGEIDPYFDLGKALSIDIQNRFAAGRPVTVYMLTPNTVNGADPKGQYADLELDLGMDGTEDFELDILNLNYEPTTLDHRSN